MSDYDSIGQAKPKAGASLAYLKVTPTKAEGPTVSTPTVRLGGEVPSGEGQVPPPQIYPGQVPLNIPVGYSLYPTQRPSTQRPSGGEVTPGVPERIYIVESTKVMNFLVYSNAQIGPQSYVVRFPWSGTAVEASLFTQTPVEGHCHIQIERCSAANYEGQTPVWEEFLSEPLMLMEGATFDSMNIMKPVAENDYFRIRIDSICSSKPCTIELAILATPKRWKDV
jgi:hypothetical protein